VTQACRLKAKTKQLGKSSSALGEQTTADDEGHVSLEQFNSVIEPMIHSHSDAGENKSVLEELDMHEDDWGLFLSAAATRTYAKGQYVVQEGEPSAALYQIVSGALRVELKLNEQAPAARTPHRNPFRIPTCPCRPATIGPITNESSPCKPNHPSGRNAGIGPGGRRRLPRRGRDAWRDLDAEGGPRHGLGSC